MMNMKFETKVIISLLSLLMPQLAFAVPNISGVNGTVSHGSSITVAGSGFGTKNPAAPMIWDNGSGRSSGQLPSAGGWSGGLPSGLSEGNATYNMQYRTAGSFRSVAGPHALNSVYLAGAAPGYGGYGGYNGINPDVYYEWNVGSGEKIFASCYWRLDPNGMTNYSTYPGLNLKNFQYCADGPVCSSDPMILLTTAYSHGSWYSYAPLLCNGSTWCSDTNTNPALNWVKTDIQLQAESSNGNLKLWDNGVIGIDAKGNLSGMAGSLRDFSFGGYFEPRYADDSTPPEPYPDDYRYLADLYLDNTWARVMACAGSTWANRGICEMQIPSSWTDNGQTNGASIAAKVNQGSFNNGQQAYLYVVDSNGVANPNGKPVTFGSGGGDTIAPAAPSGLSVQ